MGKGGVVEVGVRSFGEGEMACEEDERLMGRGEEGRTVRKEEEDPDFSWAAAHSLPSVASRLHLEWTEN